MIRYMRRLAATILAATLVAGALPAEAAARVARVAVGEAGGMPISTVQHVAMPGITISPALSVGASILGGTPSAALLAALPSAQPSGILVSNAAMDASGTAAAASDASIGAAEHSGATADSTENRAETGETAKTEGGSTFDGAAGKKAAFGDPAVSAGKSVSANRPSGLRARLFAKISSLAPRRAVDEFGGPPAEPMTIKQRAAYGLKWGLNLVGIGAIVNAAIIPLLDKFPWPQYLSDQTLRGLGRVVLLVKYGPNEILNALANAPAAFLGIHLPMAVAMEEVIFRLLGFGLPFLALAAVKPLTSRISSLIEGLPDAAGIVGGAGRLLRAAGRTSDLAFPIAAGLSSWGFAAAHFATWGVSPAVLVLNAALGLALARVAYKSRGLTAPIIAHLVFNLVSLVTALISLTYAPLAASVFSIAAGLIGVSTLLYSWLTARKELVFKPKSAAVALMIAVAGLSLWGGSPRDSALDAAVRRTAAVAAVQDHVRSAHPEAAESPAAASPQGDVNAAEPESREDMIARVKGSVVNVVVRLPKDMSTGSGFILTPDGVFITNGHVVADKKAGDWISARVPGFWGEIPAQVLAVNHDKDLAIVQLARRPDGKPWPAVKLAPQAPREGEEVVAAGYPQGLPFTVTHGIISGMDGRGSMYVSHMQTDAAINPGNSGGPLFNARGEVVGVNTLIFSQSGGSEGMGFAIMAPAVGQAMAQYEETGNIATAALGVVADLSNPTPSAQGLEVEHVRRGSAAEKAGIKRGDLIIAIDGSVIRDGGREAAVRIAAVLARMIPGQAATFAVLRDGAIIDLALTLDAKATSDPSR